MKFHSQTTGFVEALICVLQIMKHGLSKISYVKLWLPVGRVVCLPGTKKMPSPESSTGWSLYSYKRQSLLGLHREQ